MLFNDVMRPFPSGRFLLVSFRSAGQFLRSLRVCAEVQPVAVVCHSSDLRDCCGVWYFFEEGSWYSFLLKAESTTGP
jgi:hypothetical protein